MKRIFIITLMVVLSISLILSACAEPSPAPSPAPVPAPAPAPAPPEALELIFNHDVPPTSGLAITCTAYADKITELSGGRVTFVHYYAHSLVPQDEMFKAIQTGIMDVTHYGFQDAYQPLNIFLGQPLMGFPGFEEGTEIYLKLYNKFPELQAEFEGLRLYGPTLMVPNQLHTIKKAIKLPEDLKGIKIHAGDVVAPLVEKAGGSPVYIIVPEQYMSVERGLIEGLVQHFAFINDFGMIPMLPYHTVFGDGGTHLHVTTLLWNLDTLNSLPPDIQKIITDLEPEYVEAIYSHQHEANEAGINHAKELGHTFTYLTDEDKKVWTDLALPLHENAIEELERKGKPARKIYDEAMRLIAE